MAESEKGTSGLSRFQEHEVAWTGEQVSRFWGYYSRHADLNEAYFGFQVGREVLSWAASHAPLGSPILDFGSGKGFLLGYLLDAGYDKVYGCDFSAASNDHANEALAGRKGFQGCETISSLPTTFEANSFGTIFCLEVVEHLNDQALKESLEEWRRILKPGGKLVITTRNQENLERGKVLCPECGAIFHRVQHVRSFSKDSIGEMVKRYGFSPVNVATMVIGDLQSGLVNRLRRIFRRYLSAHSQPPNLLVLAQKSS